MAARRRKTATEDTSPKRRQSKGVVHTEPKSRRTTGWTPERIRTAERQADGGNLRMAADLVEAMLGDDRFRGVTETLTGVCSLPMQFESGSRFTENDKDPAVQALTEGDWWAMLPERTQGEIVTWGRVLGVALAQIYEWAEEPETGRVLPRVRVWSLRWLKYDDEARTWELETQQGRITIEPGDGTWLLFSAYREQRPWSVAPWRGLARWWLLKQFAIADWGDYGDRQAQGKLVVEKQSGADPLQGIKDEEKRALAKDLDAMGRTGAVAMPDGYALKLLESVAKNDQTFEAQKTAADTAFAVNILGQNLSTEVQAGAFASTTVHALVKADRIKAVAEWLSTETHYQLLPWYAEFNWGAAVRTPWAKYDTTPPSDEKAEADRLSTVGQAVGAFSNANVPLDLERLAEKYDIPIDLVAAKDLQRNQLFQYHLTFGLLTVNEARTRWLGLPAIKGGDVIPVPSTGAPADSSPQANLRRLISQAEFNLERGFTQDPTGILRKAILEGKAALAEIEVQPTAVARRAVAIRAQQDADDQLDDGIDYQQRLEAKAIQAAQKLARPGVDDLVALVKAAGAENVTTEEERVAVLRRLRASVLDHYDSLDPALYHETVERAELLAAMAGGYSAVGEA